MHCAEGANVPGADQHIAVDELARQVQPIHLTAQAHDVFKHGARILRVIHATASCRGDRCQVQWVGTRSATFPHSADADTELLRESSACSSAASSNGRR